MDTFDCRASYSAPASYTQLSTAIFLTMWTTMALGPQPRLNTGAKKVLVLVISVFVILVVTYGRMINGDVSIDQALLGFMLAIWSVLTCHFCCKDAIYQHV